jgi:hypothetical protein
LTDAELIDRIGQEIELARKKTTPWDQTQIDPVEARLYAMTAIQAIRKAGLEIVPKGQAPYA